MCGPRFLLHADHAGGPEVRRDERPRRQALEAGLALEKTAEFAGAKDFYASK